MPWRVSPFDAAQLPTEGGAYILEVRIVRPTRLALGALGMVRLAPGIVRYYGSARGSGGLRARLARHLRSSRRRTPRHWHVDHLLQSRNSELVRIFVGVGGHECALCQDHARGGWRALDARFGATDCRAGCGSHLLLEGEERNVC